MTPEDIRTVRALMEYEAARTEPPIDFPDLPDIPAGRYVDPRFFELEKEHLWRKCWLFAAHIDQLPEPGCYLQWERLGEPVVIVHSESGNINAFYNTCSHRGAPVVTEASGQARRLTCQYHGWSYDHEGELRGMRDPEDFRNFDKTCRGLKRVRCERYGNLIFLCFDAEVPPLLEWLGPIAKEWEEFQFENCRLAAHAVFDLDCNWKIAMEANTEVYHVRSIHPNTVAPILDDRRNVNTFYPFGHGRMIAPTPADKRNMDAVGLSADVAEIETVGELARTGIQSYGLFPNFVVPLSQYTIPPLVFWPNGIDKCRVETWTLAPPWRDGMRPDMWTLNDGQELGPVLQEDFQFGVKIQKSMASRGFTGVPLSYQEARIYHWNEEADRVIGIDNIPPELRVAQVLGDEWIHPNDPRLAYLN